MKYSSYFLAIIIIAYCLSTSCKKGADDPTTIQNNSIQAMKSFIARNSEVPQKFTVSATVASKVTSSKGLVFNIPANAFVTKSGVAVTGNVDLEITDIMDAASLILNNKPTISNNLPLESVGVWNFNPSQGGQSLLIASGKRVSIQIPSKPGTYSDVQLFNGKPDSNGAVNWGNARAAIQGGQKKDSVRNGEWDTTYFGSLDSVGWGNADRFMPSAVYCPKVTVTSDNKDLTGAMGFFLYKGKRVVWPIHVDMTNSKQFTDGHVGANIPGAFIIYQYIEGNLFVGILENTTLGITAQTFNIPMIQMTEADFKAKLKTLI